MADAATREALRSGVVPWARLERSGWLSDAVKELKRTGRRVYQIRDLHTCGGAALQHYHAGRLIRLRATKKPWWALIGLPTLTEGEAMDMHERAAWWRMADL